MTLPDYKARFRALHTTERIPIRAEAPTVRSDDSVAVLRIYDPIDSWGGDWGVSAKEMAAVLDELDDDIETIELHINSPGGEVFEAIAILNLLRQHDARFVAVVDGVAASMASVIACGAAELVMAPNSEMFIHNAWALCVGNSSDMRQLADELEHFDRNLAAIYAEKAGGTVDEWMAVADAETWFSAEEAVEAGLADRVGDAPADPKAKARFDLSIFKNSGRHPAPAVQEPAVDPARGPEPTPEGGPAVAFSDEQFIDHLRQGLDLPDDADEAAVFAALDGKLQEYVESTPAPINKPTPSASAALPDGVVAIDTSRLEQLERDAQAGRDARAEQVRNHRERLVNAAIADGRIPPARKDAWLAQLEADPGTEETLAGLAKGTIPVAQKGNGGTADLDADAAIYAELFGPEVKA